jgi:hypothetical protein
MKPTIETQRNEFRPRSPESNQPVVVDFWAGGAGRKTLAPTLDEIARDLKGRAVVAKVNGTNSPHLPRVASTSRAFQRCSTSAAADCAAKPLAL